MLATLTLLLELSAPLSVVVADTGHSEHESLFGVFYVGFFFAAVAVGLVIIFRIQRRSRNPHTGLPRPVKPRRARGPISKGRLQ